MRTAISSSAATAGLRGRARHVPFARNARHIAVLAYRGGDPSVALVADRGAGDQRRTRALPASRATPSRSTAPSPSRSASGAGSTDGTGPALGAAVRAQQMAGALEHILDQSVQWSLDRVQFGRPIAKFQAVQHNLATLGGRGRRRRRRRRCRRRGDRARRSAASWRAEVAIAKLRVGEAAGTGAAIAHQVHGAMGFTYEHSLHHATRRLWGWREEFGNETLWATRLGHMVAARGADALWPFITRRYASLIEDPSSFPRKRESRASVRHRPGPAFAGATDTA